MSVPVARWVAAMAIGGFGLAGMGYSLATRATPAPPPVVFVPRTVTPTTQTPTTPTTPTTPGTPAASGIAPATQAPAPQQPATAAESPGAPPSEPVQKLEAGRTLDVNTATAEQLQLLPGIGPSRAAAIIAERERNGPYRTVEDLARVRGIGPVTVENLRPYVRIGPP